MGTILQPLIPLLFPKAGSLTGSQNLSNELALLASEPHEPTCLDLPSAGLTSMHHGC